MKLHWEPITLDLKTTFRVAHGAFDQRFNVLVYLDDGVGRGGSGSILWRDTGGHYRVSQIRA